jgi:hydrogenase nickel incorporation protein HypA/HybF
MHELSVAQNIIDIVKQNVSETDLPKVESIKLRIGEFSNIVVDSLLFSFEAITKDTGLKNLKVDIKKVPFKANCKDCGIDFTNEFMIMICPECHSKNTSVVSGEELELVEIEIND